MDVQRFDFIQANELQKAQKTAQGFLRAPVFATRVGVFKYIMPDGSVRKELRTPHEVFNEDSLATMASLPITLKHPMAMVDPENAKALTVGHTSEKVEVIEGKFVKTVGTVTDAEAIELVEKGDMQEVSMGYNAKVIEQPGVWQGEAYDAIQTDIVYNHLAIVEKGRAGSEVRFRLDDNTAILYDEDKYNRLQKGDNMEKIKIGDTEFEVDKKVADAFNAFMKKNDEEMEKMKKDQDKLKDEESKAKDEKEKAEGKADSLAVEVKGLKEKLDVAEAKKDSLDIHELVKERKAIEEVAVKILGEEAKLDSENNIELKKSVIKKVSPETKLDEKSDVYIEARFDGIKDSLEVHVDHLAAAIKNKEDKNDEDGNKKEKTAEEKRLDSMKADSEAWKVGLED